MTDKMSFKISADSDKAISDMSKVISKQEKVISKLKLTRVESKKATRAFGEMSGGLKGVTSDVGRMAAGVLSASAIIGGFKSTIGLLKAEFVDMIRKQDEAAKGLTGFSRAAIEAIRMKDGLGPDTDRKIARIREVTRSMPHVGYKEGPELYTAFADAFPGADFEKQSMKALSMAGGPVSKGGRAQLIGMAGQFARTLPNKPMDDSFDLAQLFLTSAGEHADQLKVGMQGVEKMASMGADKEDVLARMMHGVGNKMKPRALSTLATAMATVTDQAMNISRSPGQKLTAEQEIIKKVGAMSIGDRMSWMDAEIGRNDGKVSDDMLRAFGPTIASVGPMFGPGAGAAGRKKMRAAETGNLNAYTAEMVKKSAHGQFVLGVDSAAAAADEAQIADQGGAVKGAMRSAVNKFLANAPGVSKTKRKFLTGRMELTNLAGGDYAAGIDRGLAGLEEQFAPTTTRAGYQVGGGQGAFGSGGYVPAREVANMEANAELVVTIKELRAAIDRMAKSQRGLANSNAGVGVD